MPVTMYLRSAMVCVMLAAIPVESAVAQANRLLPVGDWSYDYIERLQRRGHLLELHPTRLPYTYGEVATALSSLNRRELDPVATRWVDLLDRGIDIVFPSADEVVLGGSLVGGVPVPTDDRRDPLRPIGTDDIDILPAVGGYTYLDTRNAVGQFGLKSDVFFEQDPDALPAKGRWGIRSEDSYAGYNGSLASLFVGRYKNHWGPIGDAAVVVSDNPISYDHLRLRIGGQRFSFSSLIGELDSITEDDRFTGRAGEDSVLVGSKRRYLAAHRFDWRPSRYLNVTVMESVLYSGPNTGLSLKYFNPLIIHTFIVNSPPKNDEENGMLAFLVWLQRSRVTLQGQFVLDDFDLTGAGGGEPTSFALTGTFRVGAVTPSTDVGGALEIVSARTYNTHQPEGKHVYLLRGLATQFSDYIHATVFADVYADALLPGITLTPRLHLLAQGERDIRQPFPLGSDDVATVLDGVVTRTVRPALQVHVQRAHWWWIDVDAGINFVSNEGHVDGVNKTSFEALVRVGIQLRLQDALRLNF